ncbi:hypothetical protein CDEST_14593 [Colletotrichum destructivum]|uniref:Uncharacterized protein n=1 Tax=Colletotrichum destructivum TaxID=34406 RepID=A0AAX4J1Y2_9PEZI|nr:hypothetical protein CDEST_14593 [Colletotrichum destructivum]
MESLYAAIKTGKVWEVPRVDSSITDAVRSAVPRAYAGSFKMVFLVSILFAGTVWVSALYVPDVKRFMVPAVVRRLQRPRGIFKRVPEGLSEGITAEMMENKESSWETCRSLNGSE